MIFIRQANPSDAPAVVTLIRELAASMGEQTPLFPAYVEGYLADPGCFILLAEEQDRAVGLLSYTLRPNLYHAGTSALIDELVVVDGQRGRGIGEALVARLLDELVNLRCAEVSVSTMLDNHGAQRFYRRLGFEDEALFLERHF